MEQESIFLLLVLTDIYFWKKNCNIRRDLSTQFTPTYKYMNKIFMSLP